MVPKPADDREAASYLVAELRVEVSHLGVPSETPEDVLRTVTDGHVFVQTTVGLPCGTVVALEVRPPSGADPVRVLGRVRGVEEQRVGTGSRVIGRTRGMVLEFVEPTDASVTLLAELVKGLDANDAN